MLQLYRPAPLSYHRDWRTRIFGLIFEPSQCQIRSRQLSCLAQESAKRALFNVAFLFDAAVYMDLRRLPELFCGFKRRRGRGPALYPVACSPQAWAAATPFALVQASLGLEFDSSKCEIRLRNPRLPAFLDEVMIRNLRLAGSSVDLELHRYDGEVSVRVSRSQGEVHVAAVYR